MAKNSNDFNDKDNGVEAKEEKPLVLPKDNPEDKHDMEAVKLIKPPVDPNQVEADKLNPPRKDKVNYMQDNSVGGPGGVHPQGPIFGEHDEGKK